MRVTLAPGPNPFLYLQANADASPDAVFAQSPDQVLTNAEAVVYAKKVAYEMRRLGVKAGDVVALDLPDMLSIVFTEAVYHEGGVSTVLPTVLWRTAPFESTGSSAEKRQHRRRMHGW